MDMLFGLPFAKREAFVNTNEIWWPPVPNRNRERLRKRSGTAPADLAVCRQTVEVGIGTAIEQGRTFEG